VIAFERSALYLVVSCLQQAGSAASLSKASHGEKTSCCPSKLFEEGSRGSDPQRGQNGKESKKWPTRLDQASPE